jgi:D-3-phosphoglycerate dehydrogenase
LRAVFVDANETLSAIAEKLSRAGDPDLTINRNPSVISPELPGLLGDAEVAIIDHTHLPTEIARQCRNLKHVVFLGTGPRSYMNPNELAEHDITVHIVKGYGDTAVAECAFALMWAAAKGFARMDRGMRLGQWLRTDGVQLTGKTLGLVGFGGIAAEVARLARGAGMKVIAWNRTPRSHDGVSFVSLETVLAESDVVSLPGAILVNTARGALVDEDAMVEALRSGHIRHAGLDVYAIEPLPEGHVLTKLENVTLSAHSAFRTPEASDNLIGAALDHCRRIAATGR